MIERPRTDPWLAARAAPSDIHGDAGDPAIQAAWDRIARQHPQLTGEAAARRDWLPSPDEAAAAVTEQARGLGAPLAGATPALPDHAFPSGELLPWAIVVAMPMDYERLAAAPSLDFDRHITEAYADLGEVVVRLAVWLRGHGWRARGHHPRGLTVASADVLLIPHAVAAGLGELGRLGLLMTRDYGPRVRLGMVTTDLPLAPTGTREWGLRHFCKFCFRCRDACPVDAIPDARSERRGTRKWVLDSHACFDYFVAHDSCGICLRDCVLNRPTVEATRRLVDAIAARYREPQWWNRKPTATPPKRATCRAAP